MGVVIVAFCGVIFDDGCGSCCVVVLLGWRGIMVIPVSSSRWWVWLSWLFGEWH